LRFGVTVITPVILAFVILAAAVNGAILPVPFAANPIFIFEFVHEKEAPEGTLTKFGTLISSPGQLLMFETELTVGVG